MNGGRIVAAGVTLMSLALLSGCDVYDRLRLASPAGPVGAPPRCGNGVLDDGERCDTALTEGQEGACPATCPNEDACLLQAPAGSDCQAECVGIRITRAIHGDDCCPVGMGPGDDGDCGHCGDGIVGPKETCDPPEACPSTIDCPVQDACFLAMLVGTPETCSSLCRYEPVTACGNGDGCCPSGCSVDDDDDCSGSCNNGVVELESGETCEPASETQPCSLDCNDGMACTTDVSLGTAQNCNVTCSHANVTAPIPGDGCCPPSGNANNDSDCSAQCGNGVTEAGEDCDGGSLCRACELIYNAALLHRYAFNGSSSTAFDDVGNAPGTVIGARADGAGRLDLTGGTTGPYVDLPNRLISTLPSATVEMWLWWRGGQVWQRAFDFGLNNAGEGNQGSSTSEWFLTPCNSNGRVGMVMNFTPQVDDYTADYILEGADCLPEYVVHHLTAVFDDDADTASIYLDGALVASRAGIPGQLSQIDDRNVWIGRSNYQDEELNAVLYEFRIYGKALNAAEVRESYEKGMNP